MELVYPTRRSHGQEPLPPLTATNRPKKRWQLLDDPDIFFAACVVVATKYVYPLDDIERFSESGADPSCCRMNWAAWREAFAKTSRRSVRGLGPAELCKTKAWSINEQEMDEYLEWYQTTKLGGVKSV